MLNFGRGHHEKQFCEIILNLYYWFRCRLKTFLIQSSGSPFIQPSGSICAILIQGIMRNISIIFFLNLDQWFICRLQIFLIYSSGGPFVQPSGTVCAILVEDIIRNHSVKLFSIWTSGSIGNII